MKELKKFYSKLVCDLKEQHDEWVKSNFKMRSIEHARMQIHTEGDISAEPAMEILNEAYRKEKIWNDEATRRMYVRRDVVREIEIFAEECGENWNCSRDIFGY